MRAVRRKRLFLVLCAGSLVAALLLSSYYAYRRWLDPAFPVGVRAVLVLMVLLNARQNLRQYRYACILERLLREAA